VLYTSKKYSETTHLSILNSIDKNAIEQAFKRKAMPRVAWLVEGGLDSPVLGKIERTLHARFGDVSSTQILHHFHTGVREHGAPHDLPLKAWTYGVAPDRVAERISRIIGNPPDFGTIPTGSVIQHKSSTTEQNRQSNGNWVAPPWLVEQRKLDEESRKEAKNEEAQERRNIEIEKMKTADTLIGWAIIIASILVIPALVPYEAQVGGGILAILGVVVGGLFLAGKM